MAYTCPQCGATYHADATCEDRFNAAQVRELEDPGYGAVHHLSVPCYMLQHEGYSRDGWLEARRLIARFLSGLTPRQTRQQYRAAYDSGHRTFSLTRSHRLEEVAEIAWTRTIADVRIDTAEHYCADVRAWAVSIVHNSEALVRAVEGE